MNQSHLRSRCWAGALLVCISLSPQLAVAQPPAVADEILVKTRHGASEAAVGALFAGHGATEVDSVPRLGVRVLRVAAPAVDRVIAALSRRHEVEFAERNWLADTTAMTVNDPYFVNAQQYHLINIKAPDAWELAGGNATTVIAFVDTGVSPTHPDLAARLVPGYNFFNDTPDTADEHGHGTAVAGAAAAEGDNGVGVAGVAWNASIMPLRVTDAGGAASYARVAKAIIYAADRGIRVINVSLAGSAASTTLQSAVDYAWSRNALIIAAAGNAGTEAPMYPAACANVLAVASVDPHDAVSTWSSYGKHIAVSTPGVSIWTTTVGDGYGANSGTSLSSPITAGTAALLLAADPTLSNERLSNIIKATADDIDALGFDARTGYGRVNAHRALLSRNLPLPDTTAPSAAISSPGHFSTVSGQISVAISAHDDTGVTAVKLYVDGALAAGGGAETVSFNWDTAAHANGAHNLELRAYDAAGNVGTSTQTTVLVENTVRDTTPPTVVITSPANGSRAGREIHVTVSSGDNVAVDRVDLYVDGSYSGSGPGGAATFSITTNRWKRGVHELRAVALDTAGNVTTSSPIAVMK